MPDHAPAHAPEFRAAYLANERQERLNTGKVASALVVVLMPAGVLLDRYVYFQEGFLGFFLILRLLCSALVGVIWYLHYTSMGHRYYKLLGLPIALLPAFFITWMIYTTESPPTSPYYAGLSLILLAVSVVVHWSVQESLLAVFSILLMYSGACLMKGTKEHLPVIFNNFYFLVLTGLMVITGNYFFNRLRFREFSLRYELDQNKKISRGKQPEAHGAGPNQEPVFRQHQPRTAHAADAAARPAGNPAAPVPAVDGETKTAAGDHAFQRHAAAQADQRPARPGAAGIRAGWRSNASRCEVPEFVKGLASAARQVADDKRLRLETARRSARSGTVLADRDKLEKIVLNLVFNALKFTPAGGRVELRAEKQGDELVLHVADTGMGISEKNLPHVFDRFWQADGSSKRKYQGVGIGLALVKELVEIQGGRVTVQSQEGKGTTFTVRLPYLKADRAAPCSPAPT